MSFKRQRQPSEPTEQEFRTHLHSDYGKTNSDTVTPRVPDVSKHYSDARNEYKDREIFNLTKKLEASERKKKHIQRAFYTMVRDVRHEATVMRKYLESINEDNEDGEHEEDVVKTVKVIAHTMIRLGHCPISQLPLDDNTFINVCGHIFDKKTLLRERPAQCAKCSNKIVLPHFAM